MVDRFFVHIDYTIYQRQKFHAWLTFNRSHVTDNQFILVHMKISSSLYHVSMMDDEIQKCSQK